MKLFFITQIHQNPAWIVTLSKFFFDTLNRPTWQHKTVFYVFTIYEIIFFLNVLCVFPSFINSPFADFVFINLLQRCYDMIIKHASNIA